MDATDRLTDLLAGDRAALADLFSVYRERLWHMVQMRMDARLAARVDVDDVLQEIYLDAEKRVEHYLADPTKSFYVWLRLVAQQTLIGLHRRHLGSQRRDAALEVGRGGLAATSALSLADRLVARLTSPSQAAARHEMTRLVEQAVQSMEPIDREILALRHFEELTNSEVAEVLDMKKSATSNRYIRALTRLRETLAQIPGFFDEND